MNFGLEDKIIKELENVFASNPKVDKAFVFGSRAKGNYRPDSDIDIAIKGKDLDFQDVLGLGVKLDELNLSYKIDLLDYNKISEPVLTEHIDRVGVEFYSRWKKYVLKDVIEKFIDYRGKTPTKTTFGIPLITAKIVKDGRIMEPNEFISENEYKIRMTRGYPKTDDLVLTTEAPLGQVALIKNDKVALGQRIITLQTKNEVCNSVFLKYYFQSNIGQGILQSRASGSTVEGIKSAELKLIEIALPPLSEQINIASCLKCLDDKIDLLQRQNKTLEQLAETLFRQWFVEEAEEQSEKQITLGDLIDTVSKTHKFPKNEVIFLNTSDIYLGEVLTSEMSLVKSLPGQAKKTIAKDDILFSEIRPANGRWAYIDFDAEDYVVSTKLMVLRSKNLSNQAFVYFYLTNPKTVEWLQVLAESRSGTFPQITFDQLVDLKINIPSEQIFKETCEWCKTTLYKIKKNNKQIQTLTKTRDNLLPKLMSGEIRVNLN